MPKKKTTKSNGTAPLKKGRLGNPEMDYINSHHPETPVAEIAAALNRSPEVIQGYIDQNLAPESKARTEIKTAFRQSMQWKHLQDEFEPDEVKYFEEKYVVYKEQFRDDVYASEENQLFKLIKFEILMHRNLVQQKRWRNEIERLDADRAKFMRRFADPSQMDESDQNHLLNLDSLYQNAAASEQSLTVQHDKLDNAHQNIMKTLKATREQRVSKATENKKTFMDVLRALQETEQREAADRMNNQMRKASEKELRRLGEVHEYSDGAHDRPILSAETVEFGFEDEDENAA